MSSYQLFTGRSGAPRLFRNETPVSKLQHNEGVGSHSSPKPDPKRVELLGLGIGSRHWVSAKGQSSERNSDRQGGIFDTGTGAEGNALLKAGGLRDGSEAHFGVWPICGILLANVFAVT
jgi:hypothetical protein